MRERDLTFYCSLFSSAYQKFSIYIKPSANVFLDDPTRRVYDPSCPWQAISYKNTHNDENSRLRLIRYLPSKPRN